MKKRLLKKYQLFTEFIRERLALKHFFYYKVVSQKGN